MFYDSGVETDEYIGVTLTFYFLAVAQLSRFTITKVTQGPEYFTRSKNRTRSLWEMLRSIRKCGRDEDCTIDVQCALHFT